MSHKSEEEPLLDLPAVIDLSKYDQSGFDRGRPNWLILSWWLIQAIAFPLSLHNFNGFRCWLLRLFGATIGKNVIIRPTARFTYPWKVSIGDYCWIGDNVIFYSLDHIAIASHCIISQKTYLCTGSHNIHDPHFALITAPIIIGNGVWVATDCFIAPGVKIGANTVIGARSSVFKNIPENYIAYGNPCLARYSRFRKV
jgi:putative colanic acid biosynthesis acetyltransferase WcaF